MATERRIERLQKEILRELSGILRSKISDPRLGMISLTRVKLTADLKIAQVFASALGGETEWRRSFGAIRHALGFIQKTLGSRLSLRHVPEIIFHYDKTLENADRVTRIFGDLEKERAQRQPPAVAPVEPEEACAGDVGKSLEEAAGREEE